MPRMVKAGSWPPPAVGRTAKFGTTVFKSTTLTMRLVSSDALVTAVSEIGTSC